jgi:hypothetical protein
MDFIVIVFVLIGIGILLVLAKLILKKVTSNVKSELKDITIDTFDDLL